MCRINILLLQTSISQSPSSALQDKNASDTVHSKIRIAHLIYSAYCCSAGSAMKIKMILCSFANCPFFYFRFLFFFFFNWMFTSSLIAVLRLWRDINRVFRLAKELIMLGWGNQMALQNFLILSLQHWFCHTGSKGHCRTPCDSSVNALNKKSLCPKGEEKEWVKRNNVRKRKQHREEKKDQKIVDTKKKIFVFALRSFSCFFPHSSPPCPLICVVG